MYLPRTTPAAIVIARRQAALTDLGELTALTDGPTTIWAVPRGRQLTLYMLSPTMRSLIPVTNLVVAALGLRTPRGSVRHIIMVPGDTSAGIVEQLADALRRPLACQVI